MAVYKFYDPGIKDSMDALAGIMQAAGSYSRDRQDHELSMNILRTAQDPLRDPRQKTQDIYNEVANFKPTRAGGLMGGVQAVGDFFAPPSRIQSGVASSAMSDILGGGPEKRQNELRRIVASETSNTLRMAKQLDDFEFGAGQALLESLVAERTGTPGGYSDTPSGNQSVQDEVPPPAPPTPKSDAAYLNKPFRSGNPNDPYGNRVKGRETEVPQDAESRISALAGSLGQQGSVILEKLKANPEDYDTLLNRINNPVDKDGKPLSPLTDKQILQFIDLL